VRVLAFGTIIEGQRLQHGEADHVREAYRFGRDTLLTDKLGCHLNRVVKVENDRAVRNVQRGDLAFRGQRLDFAPAQRGVIGKKLENDGRSVFHPNLPAPGLFLPLFILCALESDPLEVLFKAPVGFGIFKNHQVDHDIEIERADMLRDLGRPVGA
jgi:hypothetical protein